MLRIVIWIANGGLLTLCGLLAETSIDAFAETSVPLPPVAVPANDPENPDAAASRSDPAIIVTRNLFDVSWLAPPNPSSPPEEEIEKTALPLGLLGTIASSDPELRFAALWDDANRERIVVRPGDAVREGRATVLRIERQRLLLLEDGAVRELVSDGDGQYRRPKRAHRTRGPSRNRGGRRRVGRRGPGE